ncbi:MAG: TrmH family RNA methyltransferase [Cyanobacteriota bacterium]
MARLRALHQPRGRREQQALLLEGTHLVQEVLRRGLEPSLLLATPAWWEANPALLAALPAATALRTAVPEVLEAAASTRSPDGVLMVLPASGLPEPRPEAEPPAFVLALDRLQDPGNLGTLLRTALAAGVEEVWLAEGADPLQPKVVRASSGAVLALPLLRLDGDGLRQRLGAARRRGRQVVATVVPGEGAAGGVPYWQLDWSAPTVLLLGNEGAGLSQDLAAEADRRVTIPHSPLVESLNVAVAAAPLLLERWRRRTAP